MPSFEIVARSAAKVKKYRKESAIRAPLNIFYPPFFSEIEPSRGKNNKDSESPSVVSLTTRERDRNSGTRVGYGPAGLPGGPAGLPGGAAYPS